MMEQGEALSVLARIPADELKGFVDDLLGRLPEVEVLANRTGLVMQPYTDTAQGTVFHLGEVLIAEGHIRLDGVEGYGACLGRDLEQALAIAIVDAARQKGAEADRIALWLTEASARQQAEDSALLEQVAATRVEMETF